VSTIFLITPWKGGRGCSTGAPTPTSLLVGQWCCNLSSNNWQYLCCDRRSICYFLITALYNFICCWLKLL